MIPLLPFLSRTIKNCECVLAGEKIECIPLQQKGVDTTLVEKNATFVTSPPNLCWDF